MNSHAPRPALLSMDEALGTLLAQAPAIKEVERIQVLHGARRVLAASVHSSVRVPPLDNSAMDGYAVRVADVGGAPLPVSQRVPAGSVGARLQEGTAARIFTGAPIPEGADAVVMQEDCVEEEGKVRILREAMAGMNIRRAGEDIEDGQEILRAGTRLRPQELGLAASTGASTIDVYRRLRVALFFTGDEIVMPGEKLAPGQIYNSNRYTLSALLSELGCEVIDLGIVPDRLDSTVAVLEKASQMADVIVTSGGVSVGEEDHVKVAVERIGRIAMWRIAMKPGKPLAFGEIGGAGFLGLPGNPVSAFVTFCLFVRPYLLQRQGVAQESVLPRRYPVKSGFDWTRADKRREFLRVRIEPSETGEAVARLFPNQSSGVLTSAVWADGLIDVPAGATFSRGESVLYIPFSELLG